MRGRFWAQIALDLAAGSWVVAIVVGLSAWTRMAIPPWLPVAAYILTAAGSRGSRRIGIATLVLVSAAATLAGGAAGPFANLLAAAAAGYRACSLPPSATHEALRAEVRRSGALPADASVRGGAGCAIPRRFRDMATNPRGTARSGPASGELGTFVVIHTAQHDGDKRPFRRLSPFVDRPPRSVRSPWS